MQNVVRFKAGNFNSKDDNDPSDASRKFDHGDLEESRRVVSILKQSWLILYPINVTKSWIWKKKGGKNLFNTRKKNDRKKWRGKSVELSLIKENYMSVSHIVRSMLWE